MKNRSCANEAGENAIFNRERYLEIQWALLYRFKVRIINWLARIKLILQFASSEPITDRRPSLSLRAWKTSRSDLDFRRRKFIGGANGSKRRALEISGYTLSNPKRSRERETKVSSLRTGCDDLLPPLEPFYKSLTKRYPLWDSPQFAIDLWFLEESLGQWNKSQSRFLRKIRRNFRVNNGSSDEIGERSTHPRTQVSLRI